MLRRMRAIEIRHIMVERVRVDDFERARKREVAARLCQRRWNASARRVEAVLFGDARHEAADSGKIEQTRGVALNLALPVGMLRNGDALEVSRLENRGQVRENDLGSRTFERRD